MTLLDIVKEFCRRTGITVPTVVMSSNDDQYLQLAGLANEVVEDITVRGGWQGITKEVVWTSVAGGSQGPIETLAPGYRKILNETIYDRTRALPIFGPRNPQEWQAIKAIPLSGPFYQYRIRGGELLTTPDMPAGHTLAFEYITRYAVNSSVGVAKAYFTQDTDTFALPDVLLLKGLRWRWREEKGLPYLEAARSYEVSISEYLNSDGTKGALSLNGPSGNIQPGIFIPSGNWQV